MEDEAVKRIIDVIANAIQPKVFDIVDTSVRADPIHVVALPDGGGGSSLRSIKPILEEWRTYPERIKGTTTALTLDSFHALIERHKNPNTVVLADLVAAEPSMRAIIDYHTIEHAPRHGEHVIRYAWPTSAEWRVWNGMDAKPMAQGAWAEWIEDHIADLTSPTAEEREVFEPMMQTKFAEPVDLITLSRGMALSVESRIKDVRTLQTGEAVVQFEEVHRDGSGEKLVVPGLFMVAIPLFVGAEPSRLVARLRYRKKDAGLVWFYQFYGVQRMLAERLEQDAVDVAVTCAGVPVYQAK